MPIKWPSFIAVFLTLVHKVKQKIHMINFCLTSANMEYLRITSVKKCIVQQNDANGWLSFPGDIAKGRKELLTAVLRVGSTKHFGTAASLSKQPSVTGKGDRYSSMDEKRTLTGDLCSVGGIRDEWLYLEYAANCEKRNTLFIFCFSTAL